MKLNKFLSLEQASGLNKDFRHQCFIYDGPPSQQLGLLAKLLNNKLKEGYRCLYLNSAPMVAGMAYTLTSMNVDVTLEVSQGNLILSSDPVCIDGEFNCKDMISKLETSLDESINAGFKGLWASGDITWEFGSRKDFSKLMEYELELEGLFKKRKELCGICQYHKDTLPKDAIRQSLLAHPSLVINETLKKANPYYLKSLWPTNTDMMVKLDAMIADLSRETGL